MSESRALKPVLMVTEVFLNGPTKRVVHSLATPLPFQGLVKSSRKLNRTGSLEREA